MGDKNVIPEFLHLPFHSCGAGLFQRRTPACQLTRLFESTLSSSGGTRSHPCPQHPRDCWLHAGDTPLHKCGCHGKASTVAKGTGTGVGNTGLQSWTRHSSLLLSLSCLLCERKAGRTSAWEALRMGEETQGNMRPYARAGACSFWGLRCWCSASAGGGRQGPGVLQEADPVCGPVGRRQQELRGAAALSTPAVLKTSCTLPPKTALVAFD